MAAQSEELELAGKLAALLPRWLPVGKSTLLKTHAALVGTSLGASC